MQALIPIVIVLVFALVIAVGVLGYYQREAPRKALLAFAQGRGLTFDAAKCYGLDARFPEFRCLGQGSNRFAYNRLAGPWNGRDLLAFDYHYQTHSTDAKGRRTTHHHSFSAIILTSGVPLKPLLIRPEGLFDKVKEFFGADDIDFESAEFSRKFFVKSPDRKWAYDVIHARTMEFLLAAPRYTIQFDGGHVIVVDSPRFSVDGLVAAVGVAEGILDRLPEYLVRQQRERAL